MDIRRILNILVVVVIIGAISAVSINFYNKSKLEANEFKTETKETSSSKKNTDKKESSNTKENSKSSTKDKQDDKDSSEETDAEVSINTSNESTKIVEANDVSVESTSSSKNIYVAVIGSLAILLGTGTVITKIFK